MKKKKCFNCGYWNKATAEYCGLCYTPFNKKNAGRPLGARPLTAGAGTPITHLILKAAAIGLLIAGAISYIQIKAGKAPDSARRDAPRINRFIQKTSEADRIFGEYETSKAGLLADIAASPPDPESFGIAGDYTRRLFDIEGAYARGIEALELPEPGEVNAEADVPYLEWLSRHRMKEARSIKDFSAKYQTLIDKAGVGR